MQTNKAIILILTAVLTVVVATGLVYWFSDERRGQKSLSGGIVPSEDLQQVSLLPRVNSEGAVEVKVTPQYIGGTAGENWEFHISMDTHSYDLAEDLMGAAELRNDSGNTYAPIAWQGDPPGGHHRQGVLVFKPISPAPGSITLVVRNMGGIRERIFNWTLTSR